MFALRPRLAMRPPRPRLATRLLSSSLPRASSSSDPLLSRPGPPPLPAAQQREFEDLVRKAQSPAAPTSTSASASTPHAPDVHPDAPAPLRAEFTGDVNPATGERGGPKREPVGRWAQDGGDWSFKGRVSDF